MKKSTGNRPGSASRNEAATKHLIPALVALGGGLAALPASALELGDIKVNSSLGQPLRASIAVALAPNEAIYDTCVSIANASPSTGVPSPGLASVSIANGVIAVSGAAVVREPLLSMRVNIRCPYTPHLSRDYTLFVDPARPAPSTVVEPAVASSNPVVTRTAPVAAPAAPRRRATARALPPIENATRYRVQPGDSLSQIAQRIEGRPIGLWAAVGAIFDANPGAFIDNDPNKLKAGSWLSIPDFGAGQPLTVANTTVFPTGAEAAPAQQAPVEAVADIAAEEFLGQSPTPVDNIDAGNLAYGESSSDAPMADLRPGDIVPDSAIAPDNPFGASGEETVVIPDTLIEGPEASSSSPNVPTASIQPVETAEPSTNWLFWLAGTGIALVVALLLFGRRKRDRLGSAPIGAVAAPQRRRTDSDSHRIRTITDTSIEVEETEAIAGIDDDSPTEENLALDADLIIGTGLTKGDSVDIAQDFGFAATTNLDLELPEEMSSGVYSLPDTDIIPPMNIDAESILESEMFDDDDDDEYDMSVIVDATKMPMPEDVTQRDLEAIPVDPSDATLISDDYTVSQEVDYTILEQDYEDELTATQALNMEIAKASAELSNRIDEYSSESTPDLGATSAQTLATVTELDITAHLPAKNDDARDIDATDVTEAVTINMDGDEKTAEMPADDKTIEMAQDDNTVEMPVKSGRTGTKSR